MKFSLLLARMLPLLLMVPLANIRAVEAPRAVDPAVWGAYAQLVGHRFKAPQAGWYGFEIVWSKPGEEIRETKLWFETGDVEWTRLVRPGAQKGELIATGTGSYHRKPKDWKGVIESDGSVSFALQEGFLKAPYRVTVVSGQLKIEESGEPPFAFVPEAAHTATDGVAQQSTVAPTALIDTSPAQSFSSAPAAGSAAPSGYWGVLEQLAGKSWLQHNSGLWQLDSKLLRYSWSEDRRAVTLTSGDGYTAKRIGAFRMDSTSGQLIADTQDEDGSPVQAPVKIDSRGVVTVQLSDKRRSVTGIDSDSGALKITLEKLTWGGDWKSIQTDWYFNADPGPGWGVFAKLVGYNWVLNDAVNLHFRWLPQRELVEVAIYHSYSYEGGIDYTRRKNQPLQLVSRGEGSEYHLFGAPVGLTLLEGDTKATQISGKNRYRFELLSSPERLLIHSEKWVGGELRKSTGTFYREDQKKKNERLAGVKRFQEARAASERSDRWLAASEALGGVLQAANEVAAVRVAQSQADLDATLDALARQVAAERTRGLGQKAEESSGYQSTTSQDRMRLRDGAASEPTSSASHLTVDAGRVRGVENAVTGNSQALTQQVFGREQQLAEQEREAQQRAQQQMQSFVRSSGASQPLSSTTEPKPGAIQDSETGSKTSFMGCVVDDHRGKVTYLSNIAQIVHQGDQQRWNEVFFRRFVAETYNRDVAALYGRCALDWSSSAGVERQLEGTRRVQARNGFTIVEVDWSPRKQH
jgi:hypothetical protein